MVESLAAYSWSSQRSCLSQQKSGSGYIGLNAESVFVIQKIRIFSAYLDFIDQGSSSEVQLFYSLKKLTIHIPFSWIY